MTKQDFVAAIAEQAGVSKKIAAIMLEAFMDTVKKVLKKGDTLTLTGFGTYKVNKRAARKGVNPKTGASINIPAMKVPAFKAGKGLKEAVR